MSSPVTARTTEVADLQHKIDEADNDIMLINRRLDEAQGMFLGQPYYARVYNISMMQRIVQ